MLKHLSSVRWLLLLVVVFDALGRVEPAVAADRQKQVLVLYSTRRDAEIAIVGDRELPRILTEGLNQGLDYFSEYIDPARSPNFREVLRLKYMEQHFDAVIAEGSTAVDFVAENRNELFSDTPIVFFLNHPPADRIPNSAGAFAELNLSGTVALAEALQPDIQHVFVVTGADSGDRVYESIARAQFRQFEPRLTFTYLSGLATKELEARLATLPERSIVFYVLVDRDGAGENFHPLAYVDRVAAVSNRPTYCWVDSAMDHGIVGGSLRSLSAETEAIGKLALRVLQGERADGIPISSPDLNVNQVDWRQLRRWGISEALVPPGTLVGFREPGVWDRYKTYIIAVAVLFLTQSAFIVGLLVQGARRRQAEERMRSGQEDLRRSYERIRDLSGRLLKTQEVERARIARELHDDISQQVALLALDLQLLSDSGHGQARYPQRLAREALNRTQGIAKSLHDLSHELHPTKLSLVGLLPALSGLRRELARPNLGIILLHDNVPASLPPAVTLCLFRIVQEALQNAIKHSRARNVSIHLNGSRYALILTIVDDGVGFDVDAAWGKGLGLISMGERLESIGGSLRVCSEPGAGTRLEITVPLDASQTADTLSV